MPGGYRFGFRGVSPPWPYVGRGRGGFPRCWYPGAAITPVDAPAFYGGYPAWAPGPYSPQMTKEQELDFLKSQAQAMRRQLEQMEVRVQQLGSED